MKNILIIEDEWAEAEGLKSIILSYFRNHDLHVQIAYNGEEALQNLRFFRPDLCFIDIDMPIVNGLSAAAQIKIHFPETILIMVTAYSDFKFMKQALKIGVNDYIVKPYMHEAITSLLQNLLYPNSSLQIDLKHVIEALQSQNYLLLGQSAASICALSMSDQDLKQIFTTLFTKNFINDVELKSLYLTLQKQIRASHSDQKEIEVLKQLSKLSEIYLSRVENTISPVIQNICTYIKFNFMKDLSLDLLAEHVSLSKFHLSRLFKEEMHINISDYISQVRIRHAQKMLRAGKTIQETAFACGFNDVSWFTKAFKKRTNRTPGEFIKKRSGKS